MGDYLTEKERYILKREQKEQAHFDRLRWKRNKKIILFSLLTVLIVGGVGSVLFGYFSRDIQANSELEVNPKEHNAGIVSMADGLVKHTYQIKNKGEGDLKIKRVWTSCMCTTAYFKIGDQTSPEFGMHTDSMFWLQTIAPGETGYLEVIFDPAFHGPTGTGSMVRTVYLSTNDPTNKEIEVRLLAEVVK